MSDVPEPVYDRLEITLVILGGTRKIPSSRDETSSPLTPRSVYGPSSGT